MFSARLIIGILSILISVMMLFQSCAVGIVNGMENNMSDTSGSAGLLVAMIMLVCGISAIVTRKGVIGSAIVGLFYVIAGFIGRAARGIYGDLAVWSLLSIIFGCVFVITAFVQERRIARWERMQQYEYRDDEME